MAGGLIISLDFEKFWGAIGTKDPQFFEKMVLQEEVIVPQILELFEEFDIHATWAVVGAMLCNDKAEIESYLNHDIIYEKWQFSLKEKVASIGENENQDKIHFAQSLVEQIMHYKNQEIGTHTFSHFYMLEEGVSEELLRQDIHAATTVMQKYGIQPKTIIMPRNQLNVAFFPVLSYAGIMIYRGRQPLFMFSKNRNINRIVDFIDAYIPIRKNLCYTDKDIEYNNSLYNVPASMFYRTYFNKLKLLESLKLARIKMEMLSAAKKGKYFHLWWHPHNMGTNLEYNFNVLKEILLYYKKMENKYDFKSYTMFEIINKHINKG